MPNRKVSAMVAGDPATQAARPLATIIFAKFFLYIPG